MAVRMVIEKDQLFSKGARIHNSEMISMQQLRREINETMNQYWELIVIVLL